MKQEEIAARVGKSRASVANAMRLLDLHPDIQVLVAQGRLSVGHAKAILSIKDQDTQLLAAERILKRLAHRARRRAARPRARSTARGSRNPAAPARPARRSIRRSPRSATILRDFFATQVHIQHAEKRGKIELEYYGDDDLQRLLDLLGAERRLIRPRNRRPG